MIQELLNLSIIDMVVIGLKLSIASFTCAAILALPFGIFAAIYCRFKKI